MVVSAYVLLWVHVYVYLCHERKVNNNVGMSGLKGDLCSQQSLVMATNGRFAKKNAKEQHYKSLSSSRT